MVITLNGTEAEIEAAIIKLGTLLTIYERSQPWPVGNGQVNVRIGVQL